MKQITHKAKRHKKTIIALLAILLIVPPTLFVCRSWLRTTGVTWYANTFLRPTVDKRFDDNIGYVNKQLLLLGVKVDKPGSLDGCSNPEYEGFGVSLACSRSASSGKVYDNRQFVKEWQQKTQDFENNLLAKGWKQINNVDQDITQLLDPTKYQPEIVYELQKGAVTCSVRIGFNKYDTENRRVFVTEDCYRPIRIFGGY